MSKKLISILLSVAMVVGVFTTLPIVSALETNDSSVSSDNSGTTGDCTWSFDESTETLTISGNGEMGGGMPWYDYDSQIKKVIIQDGVTSIGDQSLSGCYNLVSVSIPKSVRKIEGIPFSYCLHLENINVDSNNKDYLSVDGVLYNKDKTKLIRYAPGKKDKSFSVPDTVTNIGWCAFGYSANLETVSMNDNVIEVEEQVFSDCTNLSSVKLSNNITVIGENLFSKCENLKNVNIPSKVTEIEDGAFENCKSLSTITIPNSVTSISYSVFSGCTNLANITMPNNLKSIGGSVFDDTAYYNNKSNWDNQVLYLDKYLVAVDENISGECVIKNGTKLICDSAFSNCYELTGVTIPNSITVLSGGAFECSGIVNVTIPSSVIKIDADAFGSCGDLENVYYLGTEDQWKLINIEMYNDYLLNANIYCNGKLIEKVTSGLTGDCQWNYDKENNTLTISGNGKMADYSGYKDVPWINYSSKISEIFIKDGVKNIGAYAFYNCSRLNEIDIPDSVISIGEYAFGQCNFVEKVIIPSSVNTISKGAFMNCNGIESIYYTGTEEQWNNISIDNSEDLNDYLQMGKVHFEWTRPTTNGTTGDCKWSYDRETYTLTISGNGEMGNYYDYPDVPWNKYIEKIKYVSIEDGVTSVGRHCFYHCYRVESVTIPNSVKVIRLGAFDECEQLSSINIPDSVTKIETCAFENCTKLSEVNISKYVSEIGDNAFSYCENLKSINVDSKNKYYISIDGNLYDKNVTELKQYSLGKTEDTFTLPKTVEYIPENVVSGCNYLVNVNIPENVEFISDIAFDNCTKLNNINVDNNNKTYSSINGTLYSKDKTELLLYPMGRTEEQFVIPNGVVEIGYSAFSKSYSLCSIVIPQSVTIINDAAFEFVSIENVYYTGTEEQWKNMTFGINNERLQDANITYNYVPTEPTIPTEPTTVTKTEPTTVTAEPTTSTTVTTTEPITSTTLPTTVTTEPSTTITTTPSTVPTTTQPTTTKPTVKKVVKVSLRKKSVVLVKGRSTTVKATVTPTNATNKKLKWPTSNSKVAVVNSQGKIIAKGRGNATIKVMALDGSNKYATVKVTVKQPVTSVKLNKKSAILKVKGKAKQKTVTLKATVYPKNANNKSVSWKSSNSKIATVNRKGKVTAKKRGTCYITATAKDGSKKSAKCKIVVK